MSLVNKHVVVTGGTSGIGLASACLLAEARAHLTVVARNRERGQSALALLRKINPDGQHHGYGNILRQIQFEQIHDVHRVQTSYHW